MSNWRALTDSDSLQFAREQIKSLETEVAKLRAAIKLMIGRESNIPWPQVPESDVDGWVREVQRLQQRQESPDA